MILSLVYWYHEHRPIAHHNNCIRSVIGKADRIELSVVDIENELNAKGIGQVISNRSDIDKILSLLILPWHSIASGRFHRCQGHLKMNIISNDQSSFIVQFDHGVMIYPIAQTKNSPGFSILSLSSRSELVRYLHTMGFSDNDLGINKGEQAASSNR